MKIARILISCCLSISFAVLDAQTKQLPPVEMWDLYEVSIPNEKTYADPYRDVQLIVEFGHVHDMRNVDPPGDPRHVQVQTFRHFGFYDGDQGWKIRFSPNLARRWSYRAWFTDNPDKVFEGIVYCNPTQKPGRVQNSKHNPFWLTRANHLKYLFRSFHVGDRFFAENWDDPANPDDGEKRLKFIRWLKENKYNMLSIASHYGNRDSDGRGRGWDTPKLWPIDPVEYRKMERILDLLNEHDITVFPFAGFFGKSAQWPTDNKEQELYIQYVLARIGHYPNIILNIAGPEPFWKESRKYYKGAMRLTDIKRLGTLIDKLDAHDHVITVHNEAPAAQFGDPFIDEPWHGMSTMQGPRTEDLDKLYCGLITNHHKYKSAYAQETLWPGNTLHPKHTHAEIHRQMLTIMFSGAIINFADMDGNSSSGFSGSLDFEQLHPERHEIARKAWDWFETIPYHTMIPRQDLIRGDGYCLANEGVEYYVYAPDAKQVRLFLDFPYELNAEWIDARNPLNTSQLAAVSDETEFKTPSGGDDWILHVYAPKPQVVADGIYPDVATDEVGNAHLVYFREGGLRYKKYTRSTGTWSEESNPLCECVRVNRGSPDIVVDSKGFPHVFCGNNYARFNGVEWIHSRPAGAGLRDTALDIDSQDNVYLVYRGGNQGGYIGFEKKEADTDKWTIMTDPDFNDIGPINQVYTDMCVDSNGNIHLVQHNGPDVQATYRKSEDGGKTWMPHENIANERDKSPHIIANSQGHPFISDGIGNVYERLVSGTWKSHGRKVHCWNRMHPELGIDQQDNVYVTSMKGLYNIYHKGMWTGEKVIEPVNADGRIIGYVETSGQKDFAYIVWDEGQGDPQEGITEEGAQIVVGIMYPDGRVIGLF